MNLFEAKRCEKCRAELFEGYALCETCFQEVRALQLTERTEYKDYVIFSLFVYDGIIKELIHKMKFREGRYLSALFADLIVRFVEVNALPVDAVSFLPMHRLKKWVRGFDQAEDVASEVAHRLQVRKVCLLRRKRYTKSLYRMNRLQRRVETEDMFEQKADLPGGYTMIIDDIVTSGATIEACAKVLRQSGRADFFFITVAKAIHG